MANILTYLRDGLKIKPNYESIGFKITICYNQDKAYDDSRTKELNSKILLTYADRELGAQHHDFESRKQQMVSSSHFRSIKQKEIFIITYNSTTRMLLNE